jgi:phosphoserine phosphatase RsbX
MKVQIAHLSLPKPGERENGDAVLVRQQDDQHWILAVIDGLGHGKPAALASQAAVAWLASSPPEASMLETMRGVHQHLRNTRGAAGTVCIIRGRKLEACAVGNVQLNVQNSCAPLVLSAGVLGQRVATFRVCQGELYASARIALFSDGISNRWRLEELRELSAERSCKKVMEQYRRGDDDATVLIADVE